MSSHRYSNPTTAHPATINNNARFLGYRFFKSIQILAEGYLIATYLSKNFSNADLGTIAIQEISTLFTMFTPTV